MKDEISRKDFYDAVKLHVEEFEVESDFEQIQEEDVPYEKLIKNDCEEECILKDHDVVIGSTFVILTSIDIMNLFLQGKITERELLFESRKIKSYNSIYLCSSIIIQEYRRFGLIFEAGKILLKKIIEKNNFNPVIFGWTFSEAGSNLLKKTAKHFNLEYFEKKH